MGSLIAISDQITRRRTRLITCLAVLILILVIVPASSAFAHSPIFPEENHDPAHAYQIDNPTKSWAVYTTLDHTDKGDYYKFMMSRGDKIEITLMTSESPSVSGFLPSFALMIPGSSEKNSVPSYIEVPAGYGTMVVNGTDPGRAWYEPFSPGWLYDLADLTINATQDGIYYIVVYDNAQKTGNYALPVGYVESYTPTEFILIPYNVHTVYRWEGQNLFVTYLPLILVLAIGGIVVYWRSRQGKVPKGASKWLAAFAGLAFLGTTIGTIYQMCLALGETGYTTGMFITLIFIVIGIVLGVLILMYALREKPTLTVRRRVSLVAIGLLALVCWAGLYIGTILAIIAAAVPSRPGLKNR